MVVPNCARVGECQIYDDGHPQQDGRRRFCIARMIALVEGMRDNENQFIEWDFLEGRL